MKVQNLESKTECAKFARDVFVPGRLSKRLVQGVNPTTDGPLYAGMAITGYVTQAVLYAPVIYAVSKVAEKFI